MVPKKMSPGSARPKGSKIYHHYAILYKSRLKIVNILWLSARGNNTNKYSNQSKTIETFRSNALSPSFNKIIDVNKLNPNIQIDEFLQALYSA